MVPVLRTLALLPLLLLLALCAGCPSTIEGPAASADRPPAPVTVEQAAEPRLDRSFAVLGEIRTRHRAELAVGVDGPILTLKALEGERVAKGALLVQVDDAVARAELAAALAAVDEAKVALDRASADLARYKTVSSDVLAQSEVDRVAADVAGLTARLRSAEARVAEVRARIDRHAIRAPFAGAVTRRLADPGDWVTPGRVLVELASTDDLDILVDVDPSLAELVRPGDAATLSRSGVTIPARIAAVVPVLDPATRTARVRLVADRADPALVPGAPVTVTFETTATLPGGARVPRDAVTTNAGGASVVRVRDHVAERIDVRVLAEAPDSLLVEGVSPGDVVVTRGNEGLRSGQSVRVAGDEG
jgi:RND family efflux transporter MFP subunit